MGEHQISHWIDMFAKQQHPGTIHGQQVGVASLIMARLQRKIIQLQQPPKLKPSIIDEKKVIKRYGYEIGKFCIDEMNKKKLTQAEADRLNLKLEIIWPKLREDLNRISLPVEIMENALKSAGGPINSETLGLPKPLLRNAVKYAREIRGRWSFLDLAEDAGILDDFLDEELL